MGGSVGVRRHDEEVDSECMLVVIRLGTLPRLQRRCMTSLLLIISDSGASVNPFRASV